MKFKKMDNPEAAAAYKTVWANDDWSCVIVLHKECVKREGWKSPRAIVQVYVNTVHGQPKGIMCKKDGVVSFLVNEIMDIAKTHADTIREQEHFSDSVLYMFVQLGEVADLKSFHKYKERRKLNGI